MHKTVTWHIKRCKGLAVIVGTFMASKEELENEKTGEFKNFSSAKVKRWYICVLYIFFESTNTKFEKHSKLTIALETHTKVVNFKE